MKKHFTIKLRETRQQAMKRIGKERLKYYQDVLFREPITALYVRREEDESTN